MKSRNAEYVFWLHKFFAEKVVLRKGGVSQNRPSDGMGEVSSTDQVLPTYVGNVDDGWCVQLKQLYTGNLLC